MNINRNKRLFIAICAVFLFTLNVIYFFHEYFVHTKVHRTWFRYNGFAEMIQTVNKSYNAYDKIIITKSMGGVYPLVQFYTKYDPATYQKEGSRKDKDYTGFGKFVFVPLDCPTIEKFKKRIAAKNIIYVNKGTCPEDTKHKEVEVYREDNTIAFRIVYGDKKITNK